MYCPVCGGSCIEDAPSLLTEAPRIFTPCPDCMGLTFDKRAPPPDLAPAEPCPSCGKRFIDEVFAHIYRIMNEEGDLSGTEPLAAAGTPLIHPGYALQQPPYLPVRSLVLLSRAITKKSADRLVAEVPEVRGVVQTGDGVPGITDPDRDSAGRTHTLLAGCDVRADIFSTRAGPVVIYKQQSTIHIEFSRGHDPKIRALDGAIRQKNPKTLVDACSGAGTLGIAAAAAGVPHVICNDAWYAAAFWTACNIVVNRDTLAIDAVRILRRYDDLRQRPVAGEPLLVAEAAGARQVEVYHGDLRMLAPLLQRRADLAVLDLFEKSETGKVKEMATMWTKVVGGEVFIP
ncbi:hypothetical protein FGU65_08520 [Methanoculleus sp. FWC-SCC1]|uniref:Methyltransferase n=1 Tax=Methanoculleus frigidifontis TaxID=2584085 RepID=A0ABT8MAK2_9EURY|nr:hypothetical protein [Methanoculleus sp. FWC-SCC1]MDN7024929.1 hypothetical protein [Methanoculleus sp. FWC-SCC1]